jgi:ornithine carbamoyltransferase
MIRTFDQTDVEELADHACVSLMVACAKLGMDFVAATPPGYRRPDEEPVRIAREAGGQVELRRPLHRRLDLDGTGRRARAARLRDLAGYGIDADLVARADDDVIGMHCLPAHYGEEITEAVLNGPRSAVRDQAENRLHAQKALLALVIR